MDILPQLQELGFRRNDAAIYVDLLKHGSATPTVIAQHLGFSRSYAYDTLSRLEKQGVVTVSDTNGQRVYAPVPAAALAELAAQRAEAFARLLPALTVLTTTSKLSVEVYKGTFVYRTLLLDILGKLHKKQEVLIFGINDAQLLEDDWVQTRLRMYFEKAKRLGIQERAIVSADNVAPPGAITQYRSLPFGFFEGTAFEVYGDTLALFLKGEPDHLLLVRSTQVANSYRQQFELLWSQARSIQTGPLTSKKDKKQDSKK